jgi:hypothetical protein
LTVVAVVAAVTAGTAAAHEPESPTSGGYTATVSSVRPDVVGLQVRVVGHDQLVVLNLTRRPVVILDRGGRPARTIAPGDSDTWHDERVLWNGEPPPPLPGASRDAPRFVKNWRVPGRAGGTPFAIEGFLGYLPPRQGSSSGGAGGRWVLVGGAVALVVLSAGVMYALDRRRARE